MDLEVKLFNPRRVICEAVKITEETIGNWVVRRGDSRFELLTEGQLWTLYEPMLTSDIPIVQKEWR